MTPPRVSIVIPSYNEGEAIVPAIDRIVESVTVDFVITVVIDAESDSTAPVIRRLGEADPRIQLLVNSYGPGPANAIRYGIDNAEAPIVVVTMADGCDDPRQIDDLTRLVERGVVIAAASRYMPGGQQVGGPWAKSLMSRAAGLSLHLLTGVGTRDATNSFKAYNRDFVRRVGIESRHGFEIGIELTAKARRARLPVAEVPTIWLDRTFGESNFQMRRWIPQYLHWYKHAFGPRVDLSNELGRDEGRDDKREEPPS